MPTTKAIGDIGENFACDYIMKRGFEILFRNYHSRYGEIDIIAKDNDTIVFIEVKTRKSAYFGRASEYVDYRKQKKIIMTAKYFLKDDMDCPSRFDVCEVYYTTFGEKIEQKEINYIENAFYV